VTTKAEFTAALDKGGFDVIFSGSSPPGFNGEAALRMAKEKYPEIHFLFVTGHCPATQAASLMAAGAKAVISKSDPKSLVDAMLAALKIKRSD
jgi:DNA-binding NarL/FixJ family response regulator